MFCEQTLSEEQCLLKCAYSKMPVIKIISYLYKMEAGKNEVGNKQERGRERKREEEIER
jgi:hypothetical protein